jgi:hypothetical protein
MARQQALYPILGTTLNQTLQRLPASKLQDVQLQELLHQLLDVIEAKKKEAVAAREQRDKSAMHRAIERTYIALGEFVSTA